MKISKIIFLNNSPIQFILDSSIKILYTI